MHRLVEKFRRIIVLVAGVVDGVLRPKVVEPDETLFGRVGGNFLGNLDELLVFPQTV